MKRSDSLTLQNAAACSLGKHINNPPLNSQTRPYKFKQNILYANNFK